MSERCREREQTNGDGLDFDLSSAHGRNGGGGGISLQKMGKGKGVRYIYPFYFRLSQPSSVCFGKTDRHLGLICDFWYSQVVASPRHIMSSRLTPTYTPRRNDESDESPPPYSLVPTDEVTLEFGPTRPFLPPPQQSLRQQQQRPSQPPRERELSDFARDFYAAAGGASRTAETPPRRPPLHQPPTQNSIPDDGKPTRTPVPGHPLLNDGKTLVYPPGYECNKCLSLSLSFQILSAPVDDVHQATTPATNPSIPPTLVANAGISIRNPFQDPSSIPLGTDRPIDRDLS